MVRSSRSLAICFKNRDLVLYIWTLVFLCQWWSWDPSHITWKWLHSFSREPWKKATHALCWSGGKAYFKVFPGLLSLLESLYVRKWIQIWRIFSFKTAKESFLYPRLIILSFVGMKMWLAFPKNLWNKIARVTKEFTRTIVSHLR